MARRKYVLHPGDVLDAYPRWPAPDLILSDGGYGVGGFPGDPHDAVKLPDWYREHIEAWSRAAKPSTTLWFWNTEVGWASVHPLLVEHGWQYETCHTWDKGIGQVAGNVNSKTIRRFPAVTEVCVFYSRRLTFESADGRVLPANEWLRSEWARARLPLALTNGVCGVKNAATRKWFTLDHHWYQAPGEMMERLAAYAKKHGPETTRPYFSLDGKTPITAEQWDGLRYHWNHAHGVSNIWRMPSLRGDERIKAKGGAAIHLNQKPLELMRLILDAASLPGDIIWEPFGGLCTAAVAAVELGRIAYAAEQIDAFRELADTRLQEAARTRKQRR